MEPDKRRFVGCFHVHDNITLLVNIARIVKVVSSFEKFNWKGGIRSRRIIVEIYQIEKKTVTRQYEAVPEQPMGKQIQVDWGETRQKEKK